MVPQVPLAQPEQMALQALQVQQVLLDLHIQVLQVPQVFAEPQVPRELQDHREQQVPLALLDHRELQEQLELVLLEPLAHKAHQEQQAFVEPQVLPELELLVPQAPWASGAQLVLWASQVQQVFKELLEPLAHKEHRVLRALWALLVPQALEVLRVPLVYRALLVPQASVVPQAAPESAQQVLQDHREPQVPQVLPALLEQPVLVLRVLQDLLVLQVCVEPLAL